MTGSHPCRPDADPCASHASACPTKWTIWDSDIDHVGPTQLAISDNDPQWTAPLNILTVQGIDHARPGCAARVRARRGRRCSAGRRAYQDTPGQSGSGLRGPGRRRQLWNHRAGELESLSGPKGATRRRSSAHLAALATAPCPDGLPTALSNALGDLADQLVPQLTAF